MGRDEERKRETGRERSESEEKGRRDEKRMRRRWRSGGRVLPSHFREDFSALDGGRLAW